MKTIPRIATLAFLAANTGPAHALGLGEIVVLSPIGAPLRAEIPIVASGNDSPETLCFSLDAVRDGDFPTVKSAKLRIVQRGREFRLQILSNTPIYDPVVSLHVRASCGADLQRDYLLMPEAPAPHHVPSASPTITQPVIAEAQTNGGPPGSARNWQTREGETLESIADANTPSPRDRQRYLAALKRANPKLPSETALAEGTDIRLPKFVSKPLSASPPKEPSSTPPTTSQPNTASTSPSESTPLAPAPTQKRKLPAQDRLMLGGATEGGREGQSPPPATTAALVEIEERMLRMETSLHTLRTEIDKLDDVIAQAGKAQEANRPPPSAPRQPSTPAVSSHAATTTHWLELLLSILLGGTLSVALIAFLERRRERQKASSERVLNRIRARRQS